MFTSNCILYHFLSALNQAGWISVFFILLCVYVFLVYSLNVSLAGCTPTGFYGPGSNTVKHALIGMQTHTDTDTLEPQVLTHHTAWRGKHCESFMCFVFQCPDYWGVRGPRLVFLCHSHYMWGHLLHLFVTIGQEHDSSKIRPMKSVSLMGQKMKTVMAVL